MANNSDGSHYFSAFPLTKVAVAGELSISLLGVIMNALFINAHIQDPYKILKGSSTPFIVNIAVIDFLASLILFTHSLLVILLFDAQQIGNVPMVTLLQFVDGLFTTTSASSYLCLAVERFVLIAFPIWHRVKVTLSVCYFVLTFVWSLFVCFDGMVLFYFYYDVKQMVRLRLIRNCVTSMMFLVTCLFYIGTFISLRKQSKQLYARKDASTTNTRMMQIRLKNEKGFLHTITIVCFVMIITLLPVLILASISCIQIEQSDPKQVKRVTATGLTIISINFAANSFVYLWRWPKYRKTYKKLYCIFTQ